MQRGKRYTNYTSQIDKMKQYEIGEALDVITSAPKAKFDETVELHFRLGVDSRNADQQVRGVVVLPHGTGKSVKVLVIARGDKAAAAKEAGADFVGAEEIIEKIQKENWLGFDVCITTPDMMGMVGRIAKVLGPKGLMPNPKSGTVTMDVQKAIQDVKAGKVEYRLDKNNNIHVIVGKVSFGKEKLAENFDVLLTAINKSKPSASKGTYIKNLTITTTMGPGIKVRV